MSKQRKQNLSQTMCPDKNVRNEDPNSNLSEDLNTQCRPMPRGIFCRTCNGDKENNCPLGNAIL